MPSIHTHTHPLTLRVSRAAFTESAARLPSRHAHAQTDRETQTERHRQTHPPPKKKKRKKKTTSESWRVTCRDHRVCSTPSPRSCPPSAGTPRPLSLQVQLHHNIPNFLPQPPKKIALVLEDFITTLKDFRAKAVQRMSRGVAADFKAWSALWRKGLHTHTHRVGHSAKHFKACAKTLEPARTVDTSHFEPSSPDEARNLSTFLASHRAQDQAFQTTQY
eukprot:128538-Rhodomonas_salina.2